MRYTKADEEQIQRELSGRAAPDAQDQLWIETEEIGLSDSWVRAIIVILAVVLALAVVLPLALT